MTDRHANDAASTTAHLKTDGQAEAMPRAIANFVERLPDRIRATTHLGSFVETLALLAATGRGERTVFGLVRESRGGDARTVIAAYGGAIGFSVKQIRPAEQRLPAETDVRAWQALTGGHPATMIVVQLADLAHSEEAMQYSLGALRASLAAAPGGEPFVVIAVMNCRNDALKASIADAAGLTPADVPFLDRNA